MRVPSKEAMISYWVFKTLNIWQNKYFHNFEFKTGSRYAYWSVRFTEVLGALVQKHFEKNINNIKMSVNMTDMLKIWERLKNNG